ncbi:hypothetical protein BJX68DRAFT_279325 [Aspergillus pseudodeflectus]|uniref:LisH domain-containing protein n=1 Tax=Aspergillus pseudodeflectus TaxID=176178 RepID=A0ABR4JJ44_9EURO
MNQMNVAGMNPGVGGPVGGVPMVNNGSMAPRNDGSMNPDIMINNLNTYIYDYFLKRGYHDCARALVKDELVKLNTEPPIKTSPGQRREGDMNGVDGDAMMTDGKDGEKLKIPDDLPRPSLVSESQHTSFLLEWFSLFWEFFWSQRKKGHSADVRQYLQHNQNMMRLREQQQNQIFRNQQQMIPGQMGRLNNMRGNGMMPATLQQKAMQNNTGGFSQQQLAQLQKNQQMQMMQMQREHSDIDMNGHRPQSPSSAENAPSPSKRPRLEGGPMNGQQLVPNGRGQGQAMPGQPNPAMLMQNGLTPRPMNPNQFGAFQQANPAAQPKSIQVYAQNLALHHSRSAMNNQGMPNGLMNPGVMPNQADLVPMPDGQGMYPMNGDFYGGANGQMAQVRAGVQTPGGQHGNHVLQDYQMQLMLLEQQNKRRLMMARQEQDSMARGPDGQPLPGQGQQQPGQQMPPGTSPQGSRTGASPNPNDQMKRGTPKIAQSGLPGSPSAPDAMMQGRGSPMNFTGQMPPEMAPQFFMKGMPDNMQGPNGMRPPSSNPAFTGPQMGQPIPAGAANRMPNGAWQQPQQGGQPLMPQQSPVIQPPTTGTPQAANSMPPPQAPPTATNNRQPPPSPQTGAAAPPTPQQGTKPPPKKKEPKDRAKRPTKKNQAAAAAAAANTAATPSSEAEHPPTPTPSTPITPQHQQSFGKQGGATTGAPQQPTSAPMQQTLVQPPPDQAQQSFNDLSIPDPSAFSLDFSALENPDILENFDFDTFLNTDTDTAGFGFDPSISYTDGVETGAENGL